MSVRLTDALTQCSLENRQHLLKDGDQKCFSYPPLDILGPSSRNLSNLYPDDPDPYLFQTLTLDEKTKATTAIYKKYQQNV